MHPTLRLLIVFCLLGAGGTVVMADTGRTTLEFNGDWRFTRGDPAGASSPELDDSGWRTLRLPHDWSIETPHTRDHAGGSTAFLQGGIGWYRKHFMVASSKAVWIVFDGIYNNARIWINGHELEPHPYGYTPFTRELTPYLKTDGAANLLAVRVDRSAYIDCRWYPGSGIYRDVKLIMTGDVHIPQWGTFVSTPVAEAEAAEVRIETTLRNTRDISTPVSLRSRIISPDGARTAEVITDLTLPRGASSVQQQQIRVPHPDRWDLDHPVLYQLEQAVVSGDQTLDSLVTPFGIRSLRYDAEEGFLLNGAKYIFKGVCLHHDAGCVGAAVPDAVWARRLQTLKDLGCNAIRTAHNPPSDAFLGLCDRMGFLVQDEAFDEWDHPKDKRKNYNQETKDDETRGYTEYFSAWAQRDIQSMVLRDRNHPSVVMWSTGNEIEWTYPRYGQAAGYWTQGRDGNLYYLEEPPHDADTIRRRFEASEPVGPELADTARKLAGWVRELDDTRPVTANLVMPSVSHISGFTDSLDIVGYSYRRAVYDYIHQRYPGTFMVGTENWTQWEEWEPVLEKPYLNGIFLWTGINYLGESRRWPRRGSDSGLLDFAGFMKPSAWMFKTLWSEQPTVRAFSEPLADSHYVLDPASGEIRERPDRPRTWKWGWANVKEHWNYRDDQPVYVEAYANCDEVELLLNDRSLGVQRLTDQADRIFKWVVPFAPGNLVVKGRNRGAMVAEHCTRTAGDPVSIVLSVDRDTLCAGSEDVVHLTAQLVDAGGVPVRHQERRIRFAIEGDARNIGVDHGSTQITQDAKSDHCMTAQGRCLMILQAGRTSGTVSVVASSDALASATIELEQHR